MRSGVIAWIYKLGCMSRYSSQICFIAYIFQFLKSSVGGVGVLQLWSGPLAFHHCYCDHNDDPATDSEISQHPLLEGQAQRFCWDDHTGQIVMELAKLTDKMHKIYNLVKIINPTIKWRESLLVFAVLLRHFTPGPSLMMPVAWVQQGHSRMFWCIQVWQLSNLSLKLNYAWKCWNMKTKCWF